MSDTYEIDPIFLYPFERNDTYAISIGDSEKYLRTPGGNLVESANEALTKMIDKNPNKSGIFCRKYNYAILNGSRYPL